MFAAACKKNGENLRDLRENWMVFKEASLMNIENRTVNVTEAGKAAAQVESVDDSSGTAMRVDRVLSHGKGLDQPDEREGGIRNIYGAILVKWIEGKLEENNAHGKTEEYDRWRSAIDSIESNDLNIGDSGLRFTFNSLDVSLPESIILSYYKQIAPQHAEQITKDFLDLIRGQAVEKYSTLEETRRAEANALKIEEAEKRAETDPMTGFANEAGMYSRAPRLLATAARNGNKVAVVMVEPDQFKFFNDVFNHKVGDEVIKLFSRITKDEARDTDLLVRKGGDEFFFFMPLTNKNGVEGNDVKPRVLAERLREAIQDRLIEELFTPADPEILDVATTALIARNLSAEVIAKKMQNLNPDEFKSQDEIEDEARLQLAKDQLNKMSTDEKITFSKNEIYKIRQKQASNVEGETQKRPAGPGTVCVGITIFSPKKYEEGLDEYDYKALTQELVENSDTAVKISKSEGKNRVTFYEDVDEKRMAAANTMQSRAADFRHAAADAAALGLTAEEIIKAATQVHLKRVEGVEGDGGADSQVLTGGVSISAMEKILSDVTVDEERERTFLAQWRDRIRAIWRNRAA